MTQIMMRRGIAVDWTASNPVLGEGEHGDETDTGKFKIGDGVSHWNSLPYFLNETQLLASIAGNAQINARTHLATPGASAAANRTILTNAFSDAATAGAPLALRGDFPLTGGVIAVPAGLDVDARGATFTQQDNLTTIVQLDSGTTWRGGTFVGKGTDYVASTAVLPAAAILIAAGATDVTVIAAKGHNLAGCGIRSAGGTPVSNVKLLWCEFDGIGAAGGITPVTDKDGGGVSIGSVGNSDLTIFGGHYKGFPQGMTVGDVDGMFIGGGVEFEAAGQHGIYAEAVTSTIIDGIRIHAALEGIKCQLSSTTSPDGLGFVISNVVVESSGSHGLHISCSPTPLAHVHRAGVISDSVIAAGGTGDGVLIESADGVSVRNIRVRGGNRGIRVLNSSNVSVRGFDASGYAQVGIYVGGVQKAIFAGFSLYDGSTGGPGGTDPYSILVNDAGGAGSTSADLTFSDGDMRVGAGHPVNHLYIASGDTTKMRFRNLKGDAASSYGARFASAGLSVQEWVGNDLKGTTARYNNPPVQTRLTDSNGLLAKNFDPALAGTGQAVMTAGVLYGMRVQMLEGGPIANIDYIQSNAGVGLTAGQNWIGVYDESGALIGQSADMSTTWLTAATTGRATPLATPISDRFPKEFVDIAFLWNGTTSPQLRGFNGSGIGNTNGSLRFWIAGSGLTTLPSTLPAKSVGPTEPWVGVH